MEKSKNIFKYATWNIRGIFDKEQNLDSVLNEKQIKIAAITELKNKLKGTTETNNYEYILIYSDVHRST
jgi:hypothetical protein